MVGEVGQSSFDISKSAIDAFVVDAFDFADLDVAAGQSKLDDSDISLSAALGYRLLPYLAVELSYMDFGKASYDASGTVSDGFSSDDVSLGLEVEVAGPTLSLLAIYPINETWEVFARAGAMFSKTKVSVTLEVDAERFKESDSDNSTELLWGLGVAYNFSERMSVRAEYSQVKEAAGEEFDVDRMVIGLIYAF